MIYSIKVKALKSKSINRLKSKFHEFTTRGENLLSWSDFRRSLIAKYVSGKTFADIGCIWGVDGYYSFYAEECGAKRIVAVDVSSASEEFENQRRKRHSIVEFVQGDIHLQQTVDRIGLIDVVFCSGVLYHSPNPFLLLNCLRQICGEVLILNSHIIPEIPGVRNVAVFYPYLDERYRDLLSFGAPYESMEGYANWFWGFTPSCMVSMVQCAGFHVIEQYVRSFNYCIVSHPPTANLLSPSRD